MAPPGNWIWHALVDGPGRAPGWHLRPPRGEDRLTSMLDHSAPRRRLTLGRRPGPLLRNRVPSEGHHSRVHWPDTVMTLRFEHAARAQGFLTDEDGRSASVR